MLNPIIQLTPEEISLTRYLARKRARTDQVKGARDLLQGDQSRKATYEELGVAGEIAFSKYFGVPFNANETLIPGSADFWIDGVSLDVKTSDRHAGDLKIPVSCRPGRAVIYVYVSGSLEGKGRFEIVGFIPEKNAFQDRYLKDLGRGPVRLIPRSDLYPASDLPRAIKQFSQAIRRSVLTERLLGYGARIQDREIILPDHFTGDELFDIFVLQQEAESMGLIDPLDEATRDALSEMRHQTPEEILACLNP
jgi:hypothetical protein